MKLRQTLMSAALTLTLASAAGAEWGVRYMQPRPEGAPSASGVAQWREAALSLALEPWQRDILLRLAAGERPEALASEAGTDRASTRAAGIGTETWVPIPGPARFGHSEIYDPVRHRLVVFGGEAGGSVAGLFGNDVWALALSGPPVWTELVAVGARPPGREVHSAIYDPLRDRMIVFGGYVLQPNPSAPGSSYRPANDTWAFSFAGLTWTRLESSDVTPTARAGHTAIYDPVRDRMLVFAGSSGRNALNDVWSLDLSGTPSWSPLDVSAPFRGRNGHSAIYDTRRDRMVVFGGADSIGLCGDVWALSLSALTWNEIIPVGTTRPSARRWHSAIYDGVTDRMLVFSGSDWVSSDIYRSPVNDLWALSFGSNVWSRITAPGAPPGRILHSATHDPSGRRMIVFGGHVDDYVWDGPRRGDTWAYSLDAGTWSPMIPTSRPPEGRAGHSAVYDPLRRRMIVFGGWNGDCYCFFGDTWQLSLVGTPVWSPLVTAGPFPTARAGHVAVYDPTGDRMIVFGGEEKCEDYEDCGRPGNDTWALSLGAGTPTWSQISPLGEPPPIRSGHTAVYDPAGKRMIVFGGTDFVSLKNDAWTLDLSGPAAWTALAPSGEPPGVRTAHSAIYEPVGHEMVVFGGWGAFGIANDTWALGLAGPPAWRLLVPGSPTDPGLPAPRAEHSAVYDPVSGRMIVHAGDTAALESNDTWALSFGPEPAWTPLMSQNSPPPPRWDHAAVYDPVGRRMVIHAGSRGYAYDTWALQLEDVPTPVLLSLVRAGVRDHRVELDWFAGSASGLSATLYRRAADADWQPIASLEADGTGHLRYVDGSTPAADRLCYRLGYSEGGVERFTQEACVEMPAQALTLAGLHPNPAVGELASSFSLASAAPARLSLLDVTGRVWLTRDVGALGAGRHVVSLGRTTTVPAGIYWLRLTQGGSSVLARGVVMR